MSSCFWIDSCQTGNQYQITTGSIEGVVLTSLRDFTNWAQCASHCNVKTKQVTKLFVVFCQWRYTAKQIKIKHREKHVRALPLKQV